MKLTTSAVAGFAVAGVLAAALTAMPAIMQRAPTPRVVPTDRTTVAIKTEREDVAKTIRTIPISPLQQPVVIAPMTLPAPPVAEAAPVQERFPATPSPRTDVCKRHGGYRETKGRGWHCVYPGKTH